MVNLQVNQIRRHLQDNYVPFVDTSDIIETGENKDVHILSRAYAAYSVATLGNYEPQDVCAYITDEYNDNGIDLIYIDTISKKIWIVQSKFSLKGNKGVECGDLHKFIQGTEVNLSVQAKREVGKLWESLTASPYTEIFNAELTPVRLKHILIINRAVKNELDSLYKIHTEARNKRILILGNIFITHLVMQEVERATLENKSLKIDDYINDNIIPLVEKYADATIATVNENYQNSNIPQLFRNFTKCRDIKTKVITSLSK